MVVTVEIMTVYRAEVGSTTGEVISLLSPPTPTLMITTLPLLCIFGSINFHL
jgi:hypothetical protein